MPNPHFHAGVAVMVTKDDRVLLARRKKAPNAGEYAFPGGHLEHGESFGECARREVKEECGIEIGTAEFLCAGNVTSLAPEQFFHIGLAANWKSGGVETRELDTHEEWAWYPLDNLPKPLAIFTAITLEAHTTGKRFFDGI